MLECFTQQNNKRGERHVVSLRIDNGLGRNCEFSKRDPFIEKVSIHD